MAKGKDPREKKKIKKEKKPKKSPEDKFVSKCNKGDSIIVDQLLKNNPELVHAKNWAGETGLQVACRNDDTEIVQILLKAGADVYLKSSKEKTIFHFLAKAKSIQSAPILFDHILALKDIHEENVEEAQKEKQKWLEEKDKLGRTPLHTAAKYGNLIGLHYFLLITGDVDVRDNKFKHLIHHATENGKNEIVVYLLEHYYNKSINAQDHDGDTALHLALRNHDYSLTKVIMAYKPDVHILNHLGNSPKEEADENHLLVFANKIRKIEKTGNYDFFKIPFNERWKLRYMIFVLPFILESLTFYSICNFPILSIENLALTALYGTLFFFNLDYLIPKNSPSYFGHVVAAIFFHWALYIIHYKPYMGDLFIVEILGYILFAIMLYCLVCCHFNNPGYYRGTPLDTASSLENHIKSSYFPSSCFCGTCLHRKPLRSKHCGVCNKCCTNFDHHCPYFDNCIGTHHSGSGSHFYFITFLIISNILHILLEVFFVLVLYRFPDRPPLLHVWQLIVYLYKQRPFLFFMMFYNNFHHIFETYLLFDQISGLVLGMTVYEWKMRNKCEYIWLKERKIYKSMFDGGFQNNAKRFFLQKSFPLVFEIPDSLEEFQYPSDGIQSVIIDA